MSAMVEGLRTLGPELSTRVLELLRAPIEHPDMGWIVAPLVITTVFMMIYFGRYDREELGWNTAVGNSLILIFVAIDLLRFLARNEGVSDLASLDWQDGRMWVVGFLLVEGLICFILNFRHTLPKRVAFIISSPTTINLTAYVSITLVYSDISADMLTLMAALLLYAAMLVVSYAIGLFGRLFLWTRRRRG